MGLSDILKEHMDKACAARLVSEGWSYDAALSWCRSRPDEAYQETDCGGTLWDPFGQLCGDGAKIYPDGRGPAADTDPALVAIGEDIQEGAENIRKIVTGGLDFLGEGFRAGADWLAEDRPIGLVEIALIMGAIWVLR